MADPAPIQAQLLGNVVRTVPYYQVVTEPVGNYVTLTWKATVPGTEFPAGGTGNPPYFEWKDGVSLPLPTRVDSRTLQFTYLMEGASTWEYTIWVQPVGGSPIGEDPEVDNRPPGSGGGDGDDQGKP